MGNPIFVEKYREIANISTYSRTLVSIQPKVHNQGLS